MSGDWIKMRVGLTTNPRVLRIAECLLEDSAFLEWSGLSYAMPGYPPPSESQNRTERHGALRVTRYVTVTALLRFWGYANEHAKGEFIASLFPEDIDEIVGVPGFAEAIQAAGWVHFDPKGGLSLPNFHEHNTSADARSSGAERQKRYRERQREQSVSETGKRDVTRDVTVTPREEKRREEKEHVAIAPSRFAEFWLAYPRKTNKAEATKAWRAGRHDERADALIADVARRAREHRPWLEGIIPHASTYLRNARWDDEIEPPHSPNHAMAPVRQLRQL